MYVPVDEIDADAEAARKAVEGEAAVGLEKLAVREDAHLAHVEARVRVQQARGDEQRLLERRERDEKLVVVRVVQVLHQVCENRKLGQDLRDVGGLDELRGDIRLRKYFANGESRTFFLRSTRVNVSTFEMIVYVTKSL